MRRWVVAAALVLCIAPPAAAQPVPMPEVVPETPAARPTIPAPAPAVGASSARGVPAAVSAAEAAAALDRTG